MSEHPALVPPRESFSFEHGEGAERAFLTAFEKGRLHHAWLLCGPQGLGKASFAYRCARFLMGRQSDGLGLLGMSPDDPDVRLITAGTHPDLLVLERESSEGRLKKSISVDAVREVGDFFSKAPSRSAYRVCIIDSVDDLNINSANALLKILEEPPQKGILFLISHMPGRLLATLRSRCRRLSFTPWTDEQVRRFVAKRCDLDDDALTRLVHLAHGAPGRALALLDEDALELDRLAESLLTRPLPPRSELITMAAGFKANTARNNGAQRFATFIACLADRVHERALSAETPQTAQTMAQLWSRLSQSVSEIEAVNLDRTDYFWSVYNDLSHIN